MDYPKKWKCPNCKEIVQNNKLCPNCKFRFSNPYPKLWNCPNCNNIVSNSEFCKNCEYPNNLSYPDLWHCHECGNIVKNSNKCGVCGFKLEDKDKKAADEKFLGEVIEKKIKKKDFMDKKSIYFLTASVIILSLVLVLYSLKSYEPKQEITSEYFAGISFSKDFILGSNIESAEFELESPLGEKILIEGIKKSGNVWSINNLTLIEPGNWKVKIMGFSGSSYTESSDYFTVKSYCLNNSQCLSGLCCSGACINACKSNLDCNDFNNLTTDLCVYPGTCNASCINTPASCNSLILDNYCPPGCNKDNDLDCASCKSDEIICNGVCKKVECKKNDDCNDNNPSTFDKCVTMNNSCNNFCQNNYFEGSCDEGKIEYLGHCITPFCISNKDCYKPGFNYNCLNSSTIYAYCAYSTCALGQIVCPQAGFNVCKTPRCRFNSDCPENNICTRPGTCNATCSPCASGQVLYSGQCITPPCLTDSQCDDNNLLTRDSCVLRSNPGSNYCNNSLCTEGQIGCFENGLSLCKTPTCTDNEDCLANQLCINPGLCNSTCSNIECLVNSDCNDNNPSTIDSCVVDNNDALNNYCSHVSCQLGQIVCNNLCATPSCSINSDCDDSNPLTFDKCLNPNSCTSTCTNEAIPVCEWPEVLDQENNVCDLVINDENNAVIEINDLSIAGYDYDSSEFLPICDILDGKEFYLIYTMNGDVSTFDSVSIIAEILGLEQIYSQGLYGGMDEEFRGTINCNPLDEDLKLTKNSDTTEFYLNNIVLYVKKN